MLGTAGMAAVGGRAVAAAPSGKGDAGTSALVCPVLINHCHVGPKGFGAQPDRPEMGTLPALERIMADAGVARAVCFAPFDWNWERIGGGLGRNEWLAKELKSRPNLLGFATVYPQDHDAPQQLRRAIAGGLVGAKLHPPVMRFRIDDPDIEPFWQAAEDLRIPVSIHTGAHGWSLRYYMPLLLDEVAQRHRRLPIIIEHIGGGAFFDQALAVLHNNDNCYAGLTQCSGRDPKYALDPVRRDVLLKTIGPERIIYGLDYPWNQDNPQALKDDLAWVRGWPIAEVDQQKILGGSLARLVKR
jgi:predicted TIM-barrel fold metal-dependent hydrolase